MGKNDRKKTRFARGMTQLGDNLDKGEEIYVDIEAFVCALYGCKGVTNINQLRSSKFKEQNDKEICHVDLKTVPPCRSSLYLHLKRANRAAYMMSNIAQCIRTSSRRLRMKQRR